MLKNSVKKFFAPFIAKRLWRTLVRKKQSDTYLFVSNFLIGDLLYGLSFMEEVKKKYSAKIVVIVPEKFGELAKSYHGYDEVIIIPNNGKLWFKFRCLTANLGLAEKLFQDKIIISPWGFLPPSRKEEDLIVNIRTCFGLNKDVPVHYHNITPPRENLKSIDNFETLKRKLVILNPYSNSIQLDDSGIAYFEKICAYLTERGYVVYTNVIRDQKAIVGSRELRCSLNELLAMAYEIPLIVSLRSGILDFLVKTNINMFVVYDSYNHYLRHKMASWACEGIYKEILYNDLHADSDLTLFKTFFSSIEAKDPSE